jgi:hypothetical protein
MGNRGIEFVPATRDVIEASMRLGDATAAVLVVVLIGLALFIRARGIS